MSKKKTRRSGGKGFGSSKKPPKLLRQNGILLMTRQTLLDTLKVIKEQGSIVIPCQDTADKAFASDKTVGRIVAERTGRESVPVSVFHDPEKDEAMYCPLSFEEFSLVWGMRLRDEDGNIVKTIDRPDVQYGYTMFNTFHLCLDRFDELEEMLPYKEPTLDELIFLGQMDESETPLSRPEFISHMRRVFHECGRDWDKMFRLYQTKEDEKGNPCYLTDCQVGPDGETYLQPRKTRFAWSRNVKSVPIYWDEKGRVLVPSYTSSSLSTAV